MTVKGTNHQITHHIISIQNHGDRSEWVPVFSDYPSSVFLSLDHIKKLIYFIQNCSSCSSLYCSHTAVSPPHTWCTIEIDLKNIPHEWMKAVLCGNCSSHKPTFKALAALSLWGRWFCTSWFFIDDIFSRSHEEFQ